MSLYRIGALRALQKLGFETETPEVSESQARRVGSKLNVDFNKYPLEAFRKGIKTEYEHAKDPLKAGKISLDHLRESPRYYTELAKMEKKLKREQ